jgi:hypothetical protein
MSQPLLGAKRRIKDAIEGVSGVAVLQEINLPAMPDKISRKELYKLRDQSDSSRQEFYLRMVDTAELKETVEVGISGI